MSAAERMRRHGTPEMAIADAQKDGHRKRRILEPAWFGPIACSATSAERMRLLRARRRKGVAVLPVEVSNLPALTDYLVDRRLLKEWDTEDRTEIAAAIGRLLDQIT